MSYIENLGRVKGDKGKVYVPSVKVENGKRYITWGEPVDAPTAPPGDIDITPKIYTPQLDREGNISFYLSTVNIDDNANIMPLSINLGKIKGDPGPRGEPGAIDIVIVPSGIDYENMQEYKEEGKIYIQDDIAKVYDSDEGKFCEINSLAKFNNYYTKDYINEHFYDKKTIESKIGNIALCQEAILETLDKNINENINEDTDEGTDENSINTESGD